MPSSRISDPMRLRRATVDPWSIAVALVVAVVAGALGWGLTTAVEAGLAVLLVRLIAEYGVPRGPALEAVDTAVVQRLQVRESLDATVASMSGVFPQYLIEKVREIRRLSLEVIARDAGREDYSAQVFTVVRTAGDYLPQALAAYRRLPPEYASTRRLEGGATALDVLTAQLDLLAAEMVAVADAVSRNDVDRLLAHGKFLADRFGHSELTLNLEDPR